MVVFKISENRVKHTKIMKILSENKSQEAILLELAIT